MREPGQLLGYGSPSRRASRLLTHKNDAKLTHARADLLSAGSSEERRRRRGAADQKRLRGWGPGRGAAPRSLGFRAVAEGKFLSWGSEECDFPSAFLRFRGGFASPLALCGAATLNRVKDETRGGRDLGLAFWSVSVLCLWIGVEAWKAPSGRARVAAGAGAPRVFQLVTD